MNLFDLEIRWIKASSFACLTALSLGDVVVARSVSHPTAEHPIVSERFEKPFVCDAAEDRAYWSAKYGREITEAAHLEVQTDLAQFVKVLLEQVQVMERDPKLKPLLDEFLTSAGGS